MISSHAAVVNAPGEIKGQWRGVFGNENPVHIEIGMGKGQFLTKMAQTHPEINYVGIERYSSVLLRAVERYDALVAGVDGATDARGVASGKNSPGETGVTKDPGGMPATEAPGETGVTEDPGGMPATEVPGETDVAKFLGNVRFVCMDAGRLADVFAGGEVEKIYLNFSDPWPKAKHARRRLVSKEFLAVFGKILASGGTVEFKTDNVGLFDFSLQQAKEAGWEVLAVTRDLHHDGVMNRGNVMSEYEEKFSAMGNAIHKGIFAKK